MPETLKDLRGARGLSQSEMGVAQDVASDLETGKRLPGPNALKKIVAALTAADPSHPVTPVEVMAACRASQALAKREARKAAKRVVGRSAACSKRSARGAL